MEDIVKNQFNQIIASHYERLTGSKNAPGGLPLTVDNIGLLILFGGRELEMSDITSEVSDRYTIDEFLAEVRDAGIAIDENFQAAMQELTQNKYIEQRPDSRVHGYSDCKETARLLNRIFPKMQGIHLLAYIRQTIAEVESGRTNLESALSRFDQTLKNHGVILAKPKIPSITPPKIKTPPTVQQKKEPETIRKGSRIIRDYVVSPTPIKTKVEEQKSAEPVQIDETKETTVALEIEVSESDREIQAETRMMKQKIAELEREIAQVEKEKETAPSTVVDPVKNEEATAVDVEDSEITSVPVDDDIAERIAAFEKKLALVCPICKTGILQEKATAADKVYYACESSNCNFISWGKPHYIQCARCKNPFLVEAKDAAGQTILRCPRATCQHHQALNAQGVKVIRKKIVRRKV